MVMGMRLNRKIALFLCLSIYSLSLVIDFSFLKKKEKKNPIFKPKDSNPFPYSAFPYKVKRCLNN